MDTSNDELKFYEHIPTHVFESSNEASLQVANIIASLVTEKKKKGEKCVLGLATGSTPLSVYRELIRKHKEEGLSFSHVHTFNLDEYYPMKPEEKQSYHKFMFDNFFSHIDIEKSNINLPKGDLPFSEIEKFTREYEERILSAGGIDLQVLGIGRNGHIGFNEPGSREDSRTRLVYLNKTTQLDAAGDFFGVEYVPKRAISMGISTIMSARMVVLMAYGEGKSFVIQKAIEGNVTNEFPASILQKHSNAQIFLDKAAAEQLTRFKTPWNIKGIYSDITFTFDEYNAIKAVIWLSTLLKKSISKLTFDDYEKNSLYPILESYGLDPNRANEMVLEKLASKITTKPFTGKKKIMVFSPHPDDDVICMAGTITRLVDQGHEVSIVYQTTGNLGVFDHDASRFMDFFFQMGVKAFPEMKESFSQRKGEMDSFLKNKSVGEVDNKEVRMVKGLIRQSEARSAALYCGVSEENIHFLDLPFYETGAVEKKPLGKDDIEIVKRLLEKSKPDIIFAAGDLTDPHGTHRVCLKAILASFKEIRESSDPWINNSEVFLYRGAWQEWELEKVDLAIPLNPDLKYKKRNAIFRHQSQKDRAMFPGSDDREFWQRAEARNKATANLYKDLGLNEYEAIEVFVNMKTLKSLIEI